MAKLQTHTCTFKPLPLDEKNTKTKEVNQILEVKAGDSEKLDSESKNQLKSAMTGDSEKLDSESEIPKIQEAKTRASQAIDIQNLYEILGWYMRQILFCPHLRVAVALW